MAGRRCAEDRVLQQAVGELGLGPLDLPELLRQFRAALEKPAVYRACAGRRMRNRPQPERPVRYMPPLAWPMPAGNCGASGPLRFAMATRSSAESSTAW